MSWSEGAPGGGPGAVSQDADGASAPFFGGRFLRVAVTDRACCPRPLPEQVGRLSGIVDAVIVRAKDLDEASYEALLREVAAACARSEARDGGPLLCIAHSHVAAARRAGVGRIHLPLPVLRGLGGAPGGFSSVGTNVHEVGEVAEACRLGADCLVASPVFAPSCKPVEGRGIAFLREVVRTSRVPVLALGGIDEAREAAVREAGAAGACRMSGWMAC